MGTRSWSGKKGLYYVYESNKCVWYCTSQFIICQTKEKLFAKTFSKGKYKQQIRWTMEKHSWDYHKSQF